MLPPIASRNGLRAAVSTARSPMFGVRRILDKPVGPVQRPIGRGGPFQVPQLCRRIQRMDGLAGTAGHRAQRVGQVADAERLVRRGADDVTGGADLVGLAVERTEAPPPRAG